MTGILIVIYTMLLHTGTAKFLSYSSVHSRCMCLLHHLKYKTMNLQGAGVLHRLFLAIHGGTLRACSCNRHRYQHLYQYSHIIAQVGLILLSAEYVMFRVKNQNVNPANIPCIHEYYHDHEKMSVRLSSDFFPSVL